jgi:nucleoside-diphosphate kinase
MTRTLSIIKPDATERNITGKVNTIIEANGLRIIAQKRMWLSNTQAEEFYGIHRERPFFADLVKFMTSGPVVVQVLEAEDAVPLYRKVMGATNPANADSGTIRKELALDIERNTVHGSDSDENAAVEIAFFFNEKEIIG